MAIWVRSRQKMILDYSTCNNPWMQLLLTADSDDGYSILFQSVSLVYGLRHGHTATEKRETRNEERKIGQSGHTATEKRETRNGSVGQ